MTTFGLFDWIDRQPGTTIADLYEDRIRVVAAAEAAGFHAYHLAEHHSTPLGSAPSPGVFLAAVSQRTTRIRLVPTVYLVPLYSPLRLAEEIAMLDHLSRGRFEFGVGRGQSRWEAAGFGVDAQEARALMDEGLAVLLAGLRTQRIDHAGEHHRYDGTPVSVEPYQRPQPPVWYAAGSETSTRWAARHNLHILSNALGERFAPLVELYRATRADGADPDPINPTGAEPLIGLNRQIYVGRTEQEAEREARAAYGSFLASFRRLWEANGDDLVDRVRVGFDADRARGAVVVGSPAQVQDSIGRDLAASGATYLSGSFAWGDLGAARSIRSLELFASEVAPGLVGTQALV